MRSDRLPYQPDSGWSERRRSPHHRNWVRSRCTGHCDDGRTRRARSELIAEASSDRQTRGGRDPVQRTHQNPRRTGDETAMVRGQGIFVPGDIHDERGNPSALDLTPPARRALDRLLSPAILRTPGASCKSGTALALPCKYGPPSGCSRDSRARVRPRQLHAPRRGGSGIQAENWPEKRRSSRPSCAPSVIRIRFPSCAR